MSVQRQIDKLIAYQAAHWYESLKHDRAGEQAEFVRWIAESPRHMETFLAIASEAPMARQVLASGEFELQALLKEVAAERPAPMPAFTAPMPSGRTRSPRRWKIASAVAAVVLVAVSAVLVFHFGGADRIETPVGEQRTIQLAEGSIVNLNALSKVEVHFDQTQREIRLSHGEATFKVARDTRRPFRVRTPGATVEAVGTQFNVNLRQDGSTAVAVLEGRVKVSGGGQPVPLSAGEEATVDVGGHVRRHADSDVGDAIAWQQRKLVFKRTTLADMAAEFNRYNQSLQIRLEDIEPDAFRFSGAFNADDPQSLATLLMREPDLQVERRSGEIVIRRRAPGEAPTER